MKLSELFAFFIERGISSDPRGEAAVKLILAETAERFAKLSEKEKASFDRELLTNPYADSRILHAAGNEELRSIMVGIDIEAPELLLAQNYISHLAVYRTATLRELGGLKPGFEGSQDFDLILRLAEKARRVCHVPKILYHWRMSATSTAGRAEQKPYAYESGKRALAEHMVRVGIDGKAELYNEQGAWWYDVRYEIAGDPLLSIIIPNMDHSKVLARCVESVLASTWRNFEILIVENNSKKPETFAYYEELKKREKRVRVLKWEGEFNYSAINNFAVEEAKGECCLLLNNDVAAINSDWMERMLGICQREEVGIEASLPSGVGMRRLPCP